MTASNSSFYCGLDIGGANTKYVVIVSKNGKNLSTIDSGSIYFPFWEKKDEFLEFIGGIITHLEKKYPAIELGTTITAELSDAFETKREGIEYIVNSIRKCYVQNPLFYSTTGDFLPSDIAIQEWLGTSASNWHATASIVARFFPNSLLIDIGSTTTDIIRIYQGKPRPRGLTDTERLQTGELIFVGALRTNLAALASELEVNGVPTQTTTEFFACMADVLTVLGKIEPKSYSIPTPDGKATTIDHCMKRIARVVCADMNILNEEEIADLADQLLERAQQRIRWGIERQVASDIPWPPKNVVLAGIGAKNLGKYTARTVDSQITYLSELIGEKEAEIAPAYSVAVLLRDWLAIEDH
ncbi:MAG: hydantoinase/oxoprolinase family protein [Candidatus Hodarchaeales archaeon]|jgi:probable H4MPT-linked C1 transfer pathway protein